MSWFKEFDKTIVERQRQLNTGVPTLIPFRSFPRLSEHVPGIVPGEQVIITASTGLGKSRFMRKLFIKDVVQYCKETGLSVKIFLNSLEESKEKVVSTLINSSIYQKTGKSYKFYDLNNFRTAPMSSSLYAEIKSAEEDLDLMESFMSIVHEANPYGFYKTVLNWLFDNGAFYKAGVPIMDKTLVSTDSNSWDKYVPNNPNQIVIAIIDTIDAYQEESGRNLYDTVKRASKFFHRKQLGLMCNVITVIIQQQVPDKERLELNMRGQTLLDKMKPSLDALATCRATQSDATLILGIFDPLKFGAYTYSGYKDLRGLKGQFRSLILLKTREGEKVTDNEVPLCAYLGRDEFEEMPPPGSPELNAYFN